MSDKILKPAAVIGRTHGTADENPTPGYGRPVIGRDPRRGKAVGDLAIHGGMRTATKSGVVAFGGDHSSVIDSLSGKLTVPGRPGTAATAHPLAAPPTAKNYQPVKPVPGQRSRNGEVDVMKPGANHALGVGRGVNHAVGKLIMDEAVANSGVGDHVAHPYDRNAKYNAATPANNPAARATPAGIVSSTKTN